MNIYISNGSYNFFECRIRLLGKAGIVINLKNNKGVIKNEDTEFAK